MKLKNLKEGMPSGVVRMKSEWSRMSPDEQYEKLKKIASQKNTTIEDMAKRYDRLFADKTRKLSRLLVQRMTDKSFKGQKQKDVEHVQGLDNNLDDTDRHSIMSTQDY